MGLRGPHVPTDPALPTEQWIDGQGHTKTYLFKGLNVPGVPKQLLSPEIWNLAAKLCMVVQ